MKKQTRIKREIKRLNKIYKGLPDNQKELAIGLIERSAYLRVSLEDLEQDLDKNGYVELFSQSPNLEPYQRESPVARIYANLLAKYSNIHKQLSGLLEDKAERLLDDEFEKF